MRDESSTLWLRTLGANHGEEGNRLRHSYLTTRSNATVLLNRILAAMGAASYQDSVPSTLGLPKWHDLLTSFMHAAPAGRPVLDN